MPIFRTLVLAATGIALLAHPAPTVVPVAAPLQTLQLGTDGAAPGTLINWTCNSAASTHCVDKAGPSGRWTTTVTVPQGTQVWFWVESLDRSPTPAPNCWIADATTGEMLVQRQSHCIYQGPKLPFTPAPPSDT